MAEAVTPIADITNTATPKRRQYSREKKLAVLKYYYENGRNKYRTQKFGIDKKCMHHWIADETKMRPNDGFVQLEHHCRSCVPVEATK